MNKKLFLFTLVACAVCTCAGWVQAETKLTTQSWVLTPPEWTAQRDTLRSKMTYNLLNFPDTKYIRRQGVSYEALANFSDGELNLTYVNANASSIVIYLGRPFRIQEIIVHSRDGNLAGNQDYEVRMVNNSARPGCLPEFPNAPTLTTGPNVIGGNADGFATSFTETEPGQCLGGQAVDWVEFHFFPTNEKHAGDPGKKNGPGNVVVHEIQIIPEVTDDLFISEAEKRTVLDFYKRRDFENQLRAISTDLAWAVNHREALKLAIEDLAAKYPDQYDGAKWLAEWQKYDAEFARLDYQNEEIKAHLLEIAPAFLKFRRDAMLANPLLAFDKLIVRTAGNPGLEANWMSNCSRGKGDYGAKVQVLSLSDPNAELKPLVEPLNNSFIGDLCLNWDGKRMLATMLSDKKTWEVFEINLNNPSEIKQVSPFIGPDVDNVEGCYTADGGCVFVSSASMMGVPCIGGSGLVGNLFRVEPDGKTVRQLTFEQDQDWCPVPMPNGRIMYLRWEYVDTPHYFSRILMHMNPDGSDQKEYYGSGSYWPNSMFYAKPIPNSSKFVTIVTGHHGSAQRQGQMHILDPKLGRQETQGSVQQIPFRGRKVVNLTRDPVTDNFYPRFLFPQPLSEDYFLVTARIQPGDPWGLYLVDTFDNMVLIKDTRDFGIYEATPWMERPTPPVVASRLVEGMKDSTVFLTDVYFGPGLQGVPRGTVKSLRVFSYQYGYRGIGGHHMMGVESSWDAKILLGEVPVYEDGSAFFQIPSNTPISLQPLDENGSAIQLMRSWLVGMPGEGVTCSGCHEMQNSVTPAKRTIAMTRPPVPIQPFGGEARPIGFTREIQPILDKYCVGCHGTERQDGNLNFSDPTVAKGAQFGTSYHVIQRYIRRPGPESDMHLTSPMDWHASTSPLLQLLRDGNHYGVRLDADAYRTFSMWIDLNAPYHATWTEVSQAFRGNADGVQDMAKRTRELRSLYAGLTEDPEYGSHSEVARPAFVAPEGWTKPDTTAPAEAETVVNALPEPKKATFDLGNGVQLNMVEIPSGKFVIGDDFANADEANRNVVAIEKPFLMGTTEVTNEMFAQFDPTHDSRYLDNTYKDQSAPGYPANLPKQPVIRVSWQEAVEFCAWLSAKTGKKFRLPTEAEWEWAAKAGSQEPFWWGNINSDTKPYANLYGGQDGQARPGISDRDWYHISNKDNEMCNHQIDLPLEKCLAGGENFEPGQGVARLQANPWGLFDMNGNVWEWTQSSLAPYPYNAADGRNDGDIAKLKVARGGSWDDTPMRSRSGYRLPYKSWQKVYNVGFRVICEE